MFLFARQKTAFFILCGHLLMIVEIIESVPLQIINYKFKKFSKLAYLTQIPLKLYFGLHFLNFRLIVTDKKLHRSGNWQYVIIIIKTQFAVRFQYRSKKYLILYQNVRFSFKQHLVGTILHNGKHLNQLLNIFYMLRYLFLLILKQQGRQKCRAIALPQYIRPPIRIICLNFNMYGTFNDQRYKLYGTISHAKTLINSSQQNPTAKCGAYTFIY